MEGGRDALAGGFRLARIRRTKLYLYLVQLILVLAIVVFLLASSDSFSLKPFYLPVNSFIYFVILMGLLFSAESFVFKILEMRFSKSVSSKFYMAKMYTKRCLIIIAIAAFVIVLLWTPPVSQGIEDVLSSSGSVNSVTSFYNEDRLGLTATDRLTITAEGGTARVYMVAEDYYKIYSQNLDMLSFYRINGQDSTADPTISLDFPRSDYSLYYIVVDGRYTTATSVEYTLHQNLSSTFMDFVPLFAILFIVTNAAYVAYLIPLRKKYSAAGAIYR